MKNFKNLMNLKPINISGLKKIKLEWLKARWESISLRLSDFWELNRKRIFIAIAVTVVCLFIVMVLAFAFLQKRIPAAKETNLPPVPVATLSQTDLSETIGDFSPWSSPEINDGEPVMNAKNLALLQEDGGIKVSQWGIGFPNKNWTTLKPPEITNLTVSQDKVKIMTNKRQVFALAVYQPFILAQMPKMVYLIDDGGKIWGLSIDQALTLKK